MRSHGNARLSDRNVVHTVHDDNGGIEIFWQRASQDFPEEPYNAVQLSKDGVLLWPAHKDDGTPLLVAIHDNRVIVAESEDVAFPKLDGSVRILFDSDTAAGDCKPSCDAGAIRAEVHDDNHAHEVSFFADTWFAQASDQEILELARCEWGNGAPADAVANFFENDPAITRMHEYISAHNSVSRDSIGYACNVDASDAVTWVKKNRPQLYVRLICEHPALALPEICSE